MESVLVEKGWEMKVAFSLVKLLLLPMPVRWWSVVATFLDSTRQWLPAGHRAVHLQSLQQRWSHL